MGNAAARARRSLRLFRLEERGITLIETIVALVLFAIVATALISILSSAISSNAFSRQKTAGEHIVNDQVEWIRAKDYEDVGTTSGNPAGDVASTGLKCPTPSGAANTCDTNPVDYRGVTANVATDIRYVDDPAPTSYATQANYKKVTVTVTSAKDGRQLAQGVTYVAPPSRAPLGGLNNAIINATVVDYGNQALPPVGDVTVALASSSPLVNRTDTTSQTGTASFAALTPNPTATDYHTLTLTPPSGYVVLKADDIAQTPTSTAARVSLAPGQTWTTTLRIYRPSTIYVNLADSQSTASTADDTPYTGSATVQISGTPGTASFTCPGSSATVYACSGGQLTVWKIAGEPVKPGDYQVTTSGAFLSNPVSQYVPNTYPSDLTATYTVPLTLLGGLSVTVRANGTTAIQGATVTVSDGPQSLAPQTATTNSSGVAVFTNLPAGSGYTVTATKNGAGASTTATVISNVNTAVNLSLAVGSVPVTVRWGPGGPVVASPSITITGPGSYSDTQTGSAAGTFTFTELPAGPGYNVSAVKAGYSGGPSAATAATPGTNVDVTLPATGTLRFTVTRSAAAESGAVVTLTGGPDNKTYMGTTSASGVVDIVVPPTTAANPYTVVVSKSSGTVYSAQVGPVTSVTSGATTPIAVSLKTWTITVQRNGSNFANNGVNVSVTGGPFGTQDANPAYTTSATTNGSAQLTMTLPAGSGTFKFKVWRTSCSVSGSKSGSNTAAATGSTVTVNMNSSTCPPSTP